jgi:hypothetical protein
MPKRGLIKVNPSKFHVRRYCLKCGYKWVSQKSRHGNFPAQNPKCPSCLTNNAAFSKPEGFEAPKVASPTPNSKNLYQFLSFELRFFKIRVYLNIGKI